MNTVQPMYEWSDISWRKLERNVYKLQKLNTYPTLRRQIRAWLKAGVMDGLELKPTDCGTPHPQI